MISIMPPIVELQRVEKTYLDADGVSRVSVLKEVSLQVEPGDTLAIIGPSGSGKSTLLNLMGALDRPTSGIIRLEGKDLTQYADVELARVRNREIGFIFQLHHLLPQCTVWENALVPTLPCPRQANAAQPGESAPERARRLLERVGLSSRRHYRPAQLSGGERQRAAVVRALINGPRLLLADEPTGALDHASAQNLVQLLVELNREENVTLILVTHSLDLAQKMRRTGRLAEGRLVMVDGLSLLQP
jgi:ABC-type lipoprotein export system ATPase subunit